MVIQLHPPHYAAYATRHTMLGGCAMTTILGYAVALTGSAEIPLLVSAAIAAGIISISIDMLAHRSKIPHCRSTDQAKHITRLTFNRDSQLKSIWAENDVVYPVAAYRCYRIFRSYLELRLRIVPQQGYSDGSLCAGEHTIDLYIDRSRVDKKDLCRLRRAFLLVSEFNHTQCGKHAAFSRPQ